MKLLSLLLLALPALAQFGSLSNQTSLGAWARPFVCQTAACAAANPNAEVLVDKLVGGCYAIHSMHTDGTHVVDLMPLMTGIPDYHAHNAGKAKYSPDGLWIIFNMTNGSSSYTCASGLSTPGQGGGNTLYALKVSTMVATPLLIEGDNTGHYCSGQVPCPLLNTPVTYVDDAHGIQDCYFTGDSTIIFCDYVMKASNITGMLRWANWHPTATPTVDTIFDLDYFGDGTGTASFYEPAGPGYSLAAENPSATLFSYALTHNNADPYYLRVEIFEYNISTTGVRTLSPDHSFNEFWFVRPQGDIAIGSSTIYVPGTPGNITIPPINPMDYIIATANKGQQMRPVSFFNTRGYPLQYNPANGLVTATHGSWDWTGNYFFGSVYMAAIGPSVLYRWTYTRPDVTIDGNVTLGGKVTVN